MRLENDVWYFSTWSASVFKRCRRKWHFQTFDGYGTGQNWYQWIGSCFHYILEDKHGYQKHQNAMAAFEHYVAQTPVEDLPDDLTKAAELVIGMYEVYMDYVRDYLQENKYKTLWIDEVPQLEVKITLDLGITDSQGRPVHWRGVIDRVVEDDAGDLWLIDYKTKSKPDTSLLDLDPQISNYLMSAPHWFGRPVRGMIYIQVVRAKPEYPTVGKRGDVSVAKTQVTTAALYEQALHDVYGTVEAAPEKQQKFLEGLILEEGVSGNRYMRVDRVFRNEEQLYSTHLRLLDEAKDMLHAIEQDRLYPNPTRDCSWDCSFNVPCLLMEERREVKEFLDENYKKRETKPQEEEEVVYE